MHTHTHTHTHTHKCMHLMHTCHIHLPPPPPPPTPPPTQSPHYKQTRHKQPAPPPPPHTHTQCTHATHTYAHSCMDATIASKPVFARFQSVVLTSGVSASSCLLGKQSTNFAGFAHNQHTFNFQLVTFLVTNYGLDVCGPEPLA